MSITACERTSDNDGFARAFGSRRGSARAPEDLLIPGKLWNWRFALRRDAAGVWQIGRFFDAGPAVLTREVLQERPVRWWLDTCQQWHDDGEHLHDFDGHEFTPDDMRQLWNWLTHEIVPQVSASQPPTVRT